MSIREKTNGQLISIAGLDPTGGAGLLKDAYAFHQQGFLASGVATCLTVQNGQEFKEINWTKVDFLVEQIKAAFFTRPKAIKFGLISAERQLRSVLETLRELDSPKVVIDPILTASLGFKFNKGTDYFEILKDYSESIALLTPNKKEAEVMFGEESSIKEASNLFPILVKTHSVENTPSGLKVYDRLYVDSLETDFISEINSSESPTGCPNRGSGCLLSALVTAQLGLGLELPQAIGESRSEFQKMIQTIPNSKT